MTPFDKDDIFERAIKAVESDTDVHYIDDVIAELPCQKSKFYDFFPADSEEMEYIKGLIERNKINSKREIRKKLKKGERAAELIGLYKLLGTDDERKALSMQSIDHTTKGESLHAPSWHDMKLPENE